VLLKDHSSRAQEEAGIIAPLEHAGSLLFLSEDAEWAFEIEIYRAETYEGTVTEYVGILGTIFYPTDIPSTEQKKCVQNGSPFLLRPFWKLLKATLHGVHTALSPFRRCGKRMKFGSLCLSRSRNLL